VQISGASSNGKTVALKRIAWEAASSYEMLVLYADSAAGVRLDPIEEIHQLTGKRIILIVDRIALLRREVLALLRQSRARSVPITIIGAERDSEWNTYCEHLEPFLKQEFPVRYLNESEIRELLILLERHNALGILKDKSAEERFLAFKVAAERQLLVALHEATRGAAFEDIVYDEYQRIESSTARKLYLSICALHQYGAPVRAGLISRSTGISFERFEREFISPLENVVLVVRDKHNKNDTYYRSRHQHVSQLVFNKVLPKPEEKFDLLIELISSINVDYTSDRETFMRIIRGRGIVETFPSIELGRLFYDRIEATSPDDPFVSQQRAVFEMNHSGGSLTFAEAAAERAHTLRPDSHSIKHTQGEVARRQANQSDDPLRRQALRRFVREKVGGVLSQLSEYDLYTSARLAIDELSEEIGSLSDDETAAPPSSFYDAVKAAEQAIDRGLQQFPESGELLAAEASFQDLISETGKAQRALEKAFRLNPRQDWLAVRLARRYSANGKTDEAKKVLETSLQDNPSSKAAHLEYARVLMALDSDQSLILDHLRRSFSEGDNNFEAQFWYARGLLLQGDAPTSEKLFGAINDRAPGRFRNRAAAPITLLGSDAQQSGGRVERIEEGYAFIKLPDFQRPLFASRGESDPTDWPQLSRNVTVSCSVAFNRRGPRAINVKRS
jgi:cytochrome c-type biogenesis protein CcmH/NrfG